MRIIKRLIEKLYLKAYPERASEHEIAMTPITPDLHVYGYALKPTILKIESKIPRDTVEVYGDHIENIVKLEFYRKLEPEIFKRIEIHTITDSENRDTVTFEAYLRFYEED